jgi:TatD DNase family protein
MLVDSHCHLDLLKAEDYHLSTAELITAAQAQGVEHLLCVCIDLENFPQVLALAKSYDCISASVGLHPNYPEHPTPTADELVALASDEKIVAIGETGLDYHYHQGDLEWQQQRFREHIRAAVACNKPLIIHTRDAREDTINILREEGAERCGGVMHCFTETWEMAEQALALGFYISFSGIVTFKNAKALQDVCKRVPNERILVETDSPYLAPVPFRGKPNQPAYVRQVAEFVAELREQDFSALAAQTTANYYRLFHSQSC